jgi:hypothetical protein
MLFPIMKKIVLLLLLAALSVACNKNDHGDANLHITGTIKGFKQGKLYIKKIVDTTLITLDTITLKGTSDFESHLKLESPEMLYLVLDRGQTKSLDDNFPFFAEPGEMTIMTSNERFYADAKVTGSENHKLYEDFLKIRRRFTDQRMGLLEKSSNNNNVAQLDSISREMKNLEDRRYLYTAQFALTNAKHEIAPYLAISEIPDINFKYLDTIHKSMTPEIAKSRYGKMLTDYVKERGKEQAELKK